MGRASGQRTAAAANGGASRRGVPLKWTDERIQAELAAVIGDGAVFPTQKELSAMGRRDLSAAVSAHGGAEEWAQRLGVKLRGELGAYTMEVALADARRLIAEHGHLPGTNKLRQLDEGRLAEKVLRAGGAAAFCAAHGLPLPPATMRGRRPPGYPSARR